MIFARVQSCISYRRERELISLQVGLRVKASKAPE